MTAPAGPVVKERIIQSVRWLVWSRGVAQTVSFVSTLLVARLLSPGDYGLMALATIWTSTLVLVAELGLGGAIIQFPHLEEGELNACFWLTMAMAGAGYAGLYAGAPAIASWFGTPKLSDVLPVVALTLPLTALRVVPEGLLRKRLEIDKVSRAEVAGVLVTLPLVLGLAWLGMGVWALVAGSLVLALVQLLAVSWYVRWRPGLHLGSTRLTAILRYSLTTLGVRAGWTAYEQADRFVLGKVSGNAIVLGHYTMARLLATLPVEKISAVANQLVSPMLAALQTDRSAMRDSFLRGLRLVACLTVPFCAGMAVVADDLVFVALSEKWMPMVPLLQILCLFGLIRCLDTLLPGVLFARYRGGFLFWRTAALLLVMPLIFWAGAARWGAVGVALGLTVVYPLFSIRMAAEALAELDLDWRTVWSQLAPIAGATAAMVALMLIVRWSMPGSSVGDRLVRLAVASGPGVLLYAAAIFWRGRRVAGEVMEVAGLFLPRALSASKTNG